MALANDEFPTKDKLALYPYHRESRRMHGMVRMLVQHVSKPFDTPQPLFTTGIAVGDYPVDHHHKKNSAAPQHLEFFPVPSFNIPLGALIPKAVSNFIVAEKSISVSNIVNGTTRLQPCVMQIGQASGLLAALSIKNRVDPKNISVRQVQQALLDANGYIMPYKDVTQKDRYFKAIQKIGATGLLRGVGVPTGWANASYFNPNDKVKLDEFSIAWNKKFIAHSLKSGNDLTISDALFVAAKLSNTSVEKIKSSFELKWKSSGLENYDLQRPILRYELAAILDQYNVFNIFDVDIYGNYTKL